MKTYLDFTDRRHLELFLARMDTHGNVLRRLEDYRKGFSSEWGYDYDRPGQGGAPLPRIPGEIKL
jgi:hypothetical protein